MKANTVCENLLSIIRNSGLKFVLSETLFSVNIVLKKTLICSKDVSNLHSPLNQSGFFKLLFPGPDCCVDENVKCKSDMQSGESQTEADH